MTITQIVVIVMGLFFGYRLVSYMLSPGNGERNGQSSRSPNDEPSATNQGGQSYGQTGTRTPPPPEAAPTWYRTLGVSESASLEEIDHGYRVQISQYHPDKVAKLGEDIRRLAEERSKEINSAYELAIRLLRR